MCSASFSYPPTSLIAPTITAIAFRHFLVSFCLLKVRHFTKDKGLNSEGCFSFICVTVHESRVFVQSFRLSPAGFGFLPFLHPSLLLVSSLCSTHCPPSCQVQISLHSPVFHLGGGGTDRRDDEDIGHPEITQTDTC